jgi:hypothetical protein
MYVRGVAKAKANMHVGLADLVLIVHRHAHGEAARVRTAHTGRV